MELCMYHFLYMFFLEGFWYQFGALNILFFLRYLNYVVFICYKNLTKHKYY